ncbi:sigma-70 family RNA polymerase sigma factor [Flaviaesturariibacter flavus]|uniref:Sigma-70 family RNA polymerase sigma factor n=1 Tax=Flaviaesturariibacter flavus TaxID=2502780 RepID=A0A4R1BA44_9BACT|nr:sigma-70 family RNA polymerase sigma factor [Flaviaesturariibacter flavus]TCJ13787.1 sigma-70 family RNA polymerase sigma factor [Flaviaesturariibacter flavus]
MPTETADIDIIHRVLRGDRQAFAGLVERYQSLVFTVVLRYVKTREDAEEVSQDVFVKAYRALADFKGESKFSTWLYTIATTSSLTWLRKKRLVTRSLDDEHTSGRAEQISGGIGADTIEQKSRIELVNKALQLVSPEDAHILTLYYKGEQTLEEISAVLGVETNAAKVRLHRARTRLREKMQSHFAREVGDLY